MTDSVTGSLLNEGSPRTSLCGLPAEMLWTIFSHLDLVSLVHLSATCHALRHHVHEIFTSRIEAQASKYPEVKQSLHRLGWEKKHDSSDCKCFKMMAGPCFTWSHLEEKRSFPIACNSDPFLSRIQSTSTAGKIFFATLSREVKYAEMEPEGGVEHLSLRTLNITSNNFFVYNLYLASHDNMLAVMLTRLFHGANVSVSIFNASDVEKVCEINLCERVPGVTACSMGMALTRDTMVAHIDYNVQGRMESEIQIWKVNTEDPRKESSCINDEFIVILDVVVKVFRRNGDYPLASLIGIENVKAMAMQGGLGDHLVLALMSYDADNAPELTVKVYSSSVGNLVVQKDIPMIRHNAPFFMKWFGDHLIISSQRGNTISLFSWQPGLASFLTSPCGEPVLRRSPRANCGAIGMWTANCLQLDFQGITTAVCHQEFRNVFLKTWKSES